MALVRHRRGAVEQRRGRLTSETVALMRSLVVIEAQELGQTPRERRTAGEVAATKLHPPVFLENILLTLRWRGSSGRAREACRVVGQPFSPGHIVTDCGTRRQPHQRT